jgi:hypothetical protein
MGRGDESLVDATRAWKSGSGATWLELLQALVPALRRARRHPACSATVR